MFKKAKLKLILNHPFFASIALKMEYVEDESIATAGISHRKIHYNPNFVKNLSLPHQEGLLAHEILHHILLHHIRGADKNPDIWNMACDYAINPILVKSGFSIPDGGLIDFRFHGMSADEIYKIIYKDSDKDDSGQNDENGKSAESDSAPWNWGKVIVSDDSTIIQDEAEAKIDAVEAINIGKQAGDIPKGMERSVLQLIEPMKNWRELLLKFISEIAKNDYDWSMPNNRYIVSGLYLPQLKSLELSKVVFAIDTSGSIDIKLLGVFVSELKEAMQLFNFQVTVIHFDSTVTKVEELYADEDITPVGGGGTRFQPVFDYVNENLQDAKAVVFFTDGDNFDKVTEPNYEVLWIIYNNSQFNIGFGETVFIQN